MSILNIFSQDAFSVMRLTDALREIKYTPSRIGQMGLTALLTSLLSRLGRRAALYAALVAAVVLALWVAVQRGRHAAKADYAIRRAEARIRSMQTARETRHEVRTKDRADLDARAERWMRD